MKTFTYHDYIDCIHTLRLNAVMRLAEEGETYQLEKKKEKNPRNRHDKLVKSILKDEKEMAKLINDFLEPNQKIESRNLEKYTNSYITKKYQSKEADIVYYLKNQEIFFLVEHQSTIDYRMPYRILNYCIDIMQEWSKTRKIKRKTNYPIIVPIIIYTGAEKWKIPKNFKEKQICNYAFERYKISLEYNLIEINKLSTKFLLQKKSLFGYGMIIEKSRNREELNQNLAIIIENVKDSKKLEEIRNMITYLMSDALEEGVEEELIERIQNKIGKEEKDMSSLYERLVNEFRQDIRQAKKEERLVTRIETRFEIAKELLIRKVKDSIIKESAQMTQEELDKIKKELLLEEKKNR